MNIDRNDPQIQRLIQSFSDNREGIRKMATKKMATFGADAVSLLIELLMESQGYAADCAAEALQLIGNPAIPGLLEAMNSQDRSKRWAATNVLSAMGDEAREMVTRSRPISSRQTAINIKGL